MPSVHFAHCTFTGTVQECLEFHRGLVLLNTEGIRRQHSRKGEEEQERQEFEPFLLQELQEESKIESLFIEVADTHVSANTPSQGEKGAKGEEKGQRFLCEQQQSSQRKIQSQSPIEGEVPEGSPSGEIQFPEGHNARSQTQEGSNIEQFKGLRASTPVQRGKEEEGCVITTLPFTNGEVPSGETGASFGAPCLAEAQRTEGEIGGEGHARCPTPSISSPEELCKRAQDGVAQETMWFSISTPRKGECSPKQGEREVQIRPLEEHAQNTSRCENVAALVALGNKGTGLCAKARRQFWFHRNKTKSDTLPIFKGAICILLLHRTIEGFYDLPSDAQTKHMDNMHKRLLNMDVAQIAQLAQEQGILASEALGAFQQLLLLRRARGEYG